MRRFSCGEADWLLGRSVDPRDATRYAYGVTLSDIVETIDADGCEECGREDRLVVERFGEQLSVVCEFCATN